MKGDENIFFMGIEPVTTGCLETNYTTEPNIHDISESVSYSNLQFKGFGSLSQVRTDDTKY